MNGIVEPEQPLGLVHPLAPTNPALDLLAKQYAESQHPLYVVVYRKLKSGRLEIVSHAELGLTAATKRVLADLCTTTVTELVGKLPIPTLEVRHTLLPDLKCTAEKRTSPTEPTLLVVWTTWEHISLAERKLVESTLKHTLGCAYTILDRSSP